MITKCFKLIIFKLLNKLYRWENCQYLNVYAKFVLITINIP